MNPVLRATSALHALALALAASALPVLAQDKEELVVMSTFAPNEATGPAFAAAVASFTEETGIPVRTVFSGAVEMYTAYETSVLAGQEPDILIINLYDKALDWTENGATFPVNDYLAEWELDTVINPAAVADWTDSEGRVAALPFRGFTWPVWYNMAVLGQVGITEVPTTYDALIEAATKLRAAGFAPIAVGGSDWSGQKLLLQIIQLTVEPEQTQQLLAQGGYCASPAAMAGIEGFVQLRDAGVFIDDVEGLSAPNMMTAFFEGQAAIMSTGSWAFPQTPRTMVPDVVLGGFPLPEGSTFEKPVAYRAFTEGGFWLTRASLERLDDYRAFVEHMYTPEVVASFVETAGMVPVTELPDLVASLENQPLLLEAVNEMPASVDYAVFPDFWVPGSKTQSLINATSAAFAPGTTADAICAALDAVYQ
jgi:multiple sugar transport system substrate-binding protein